jgi:hypothetical protein
MLGGTLLVSACGKGTGAGAVKSRNAISSAASSDRNNGGLIDLNSASKTQWIELPGTGASDNLLNSNVSHRIFSH